MSDTTLDSSPEVREVIFPLGLFMSIREKALSKFNVTRNETSLLLNKERENRTKWDHQHFMGKCF